MNKSICKLTVLFSAIILVSACELPDPKFEPKFKVSNELVGLDIRKIIKVNEVQILGYKTRVGDTLDISLNIRLINPKGLSKNEDSLTYIQKKIAGNVKNLLKDTSQFKVYNIFFIRIDTVKNVMGTLITDQGISHRSFYAGDL